MKFEDSRDADTIEKLDTIEKHILMISWIDETLDSRKILVIEQYRE